MKAFLKYTLATIVGIIITTIIFFLVMGGIVSAMIAMTQKEVLVKDNSLLVIKLDTEVVDRAPNDPFQDLNLPGMESSKKVGIDDILSAIEKAKNEDKIKGIYLRLDNVLAGYSATEEIRNALVDFKKSGKFIYAYSETYSQKAYYLASTADKVFINPEGMLIFTGLSAQPMFYKNALDKLGIEMQIIRHGKFKAAVEPFILDKMSPENREQVEVYMGSIWKNILGGISQSRNVSVAELNNIADQNLTFSKPQVALNYHLVDSILYEDQVLDFLRLKAGVKENKEIPALSIGEMKNLVTKREHKGLAKDKLAIIYAAGEIGMESASSFSGDESIGGRDLAKEIRLARIDSTIKAIVLRINSPGGSALASELIWREVDLAAKTKTVVVSMGNVAASGGYYIACAADTIVANPSTITGSIGVFGVVPNTQKLFEDKLGLNTDVVKTNKLSDMPAISRPLTETERTLMQNMVEDVYSTFVSHVAQGRGMTFQQVDEIGQGRVWTGENAQKLGLVDVLGDLDKAVEIAEEMAGLDHYRIVKLPKQKDPIEELLGGFSAKIRYNAIESEMGEAAKYYMSLHKIVNSKGVMARIPYSFDLN